MKRRISLAVALAGAILVLTGAVLALSYAEKETENYMRSSERMALIDLCDALCDLEEALKAEDPGAVGRCAGRAEAYLSRAALCGSEQIYERLDEICKQADMGVFDEEEVNPLSNAARLALEGDGGEALRRLTRSKTDSAFYEDTEDGELGAEQSFGGISRKRNDLAEERARAFACENAALYRCECGGCDPSEMKFVGKNVYIVLTGDAGHVLLYCFDREPIEGCSVTKEKALQSAERLIYKERIKLSGSAERKMREDENVYRFEFGTAGDGGAIRIEIYKDTGTLRMYDAVSYYKPTDQPSLS